MIRALAAAIALLCLVSVFAWHLGGRLHEAREETKAVKGQLAVCESQRAEAVKATRDWQTLYDSDMKAKDAAYAKQIEDLRATNRATCKAQFDAGYQYGVHIGAAKPGGVRGEGADFAEYWSGQATTR